MIEYIKYYKTQSLIDSPLCDLFLKGTEKLIPIVFSHGVVSNRNYYTWAGQEFASCGYIFFVLDHFDGSCVYTELKDGTPVPFDTKTLHPNFVYKWGSDKSEAGKRFWPNMLDKRVEEVKALIDEI